MTGPQEPPGVDPSRPSPARVYDYLLRDDQASRVILADMRDPDAMLGHPDLRALIDFSQPAGLLPQAIQVLAEVGQRAAGGAFHRTKDEVRAFFDGLRLVAPYPGADLDVTWVGLWGCEDPVLADSDGSRWLYCGVAGK